MHGLTAEHYTSAAIHERERERIFGRLWLFAGLKMMVARSGAYYARRLAGRPIVLQNLGGEIACFLNSCAHRNAEVQPEGLGVRGFVCGYHGFRYAIDGSVAHIPMEEAYFRYSPEQRACLKLKRFALEQVGQFLFVNFADDPLPIREQFSDAVLSDLTGFSEYLDTDLIHANHDYRFNWKLPAENLRDTLHVRFVHPQTLAPIFDFEQSLALGSEPPRARPSLRDASFGGVEGHAKRDLSWPFWELLERWPSFGDDYYNWLLYPNLHIVTPDGGRTFGVEQYDPLDASTTRLVHFMLIGKRKAPIPYGDALLRNCLRNARAVLEEDAKIMEGAQRGLVAGSPPIRHGAYEEQLQRFLCVTGDLLHV